jgi:hypothetical protein
VSVQTLIPADGDFEAWENELTEPEAQFRPSKAALRREAHEQIQRGLGIRRHRTHEREA